MTPKAYLLKDRVFYESEVPAVDYVFQHPDLFKLLKEDYENDFSYGEEKCHASLQVLGIVSRVIADGWVLLERTKDQPHWTMLLQSLERDGREIRAFLSASIKFGYFCREDGLTHGSLGDGIRRSWEREGIGSFLEEIPSYTSKVPFDLKENTNSQKML